MPEVTTTTPSAPTIPAGTGGSAGGTPPGNVPAAKAAERPSWLPAEFETPEAFAAEYSKIKGTSTSKAEPVVPPTPEDATKAVADTGLDMTALGDEFAKNGKLSDASIQKLAAKGISQAHIEAYAQGRQAQAAKMTSAMQEAVGGQETLQSILEWGKTNLSPEAIAAYNKAVVSEDSAAATLLMRGIASQYLAAIGTDSTLLNAASLPANGGVKPFKSNAEVVEAMRDKRYNTDPAYREQVARRLSAS